MYSQITYAVFAAVSVACLVWIFTRRHRVLTPASAARRMHPDPLRGLDAYLDVGPETQIPSRRLRPFSEASGGLRGAWQRWENARGWVHVCEYALTENVVEEKSLIRMRQLYGEVTAETLLFLVEKVIGVAVPNIIASHGVGALQSYWRMSQDAYAIFEEHDWMIDDTSLERFL